MHEIGSRVLSCSIQTQWTGWLYSNTQQTGWFKCWLNPDHGNSGSDCQALQRVRLPRLQASSTHREVPCKHVCFIWAFDRWLCYISECPLKHLCHSLKRTNIDIRVYTISSFEHCCRHSKPSQDTFTRRRAYEQSLLIEYERRYKAQMWSSPYCM